MKNQMDYKTKDGGTVEINSTPEAQAAAKRLQAYAEKIGKETGRNKGESNNKKSDK